jgi:response regulator RpfG family c-di-GMP phosphodiesterase
MPATNHIGVNSMKTILFVDDEIQILKALKRLFHSSPYEVLFAESAKDALELFAEKTIDLIMTDIRMPDMDGFELLRIIKKKYPLTLRVTLSGYTDSKNIFKALEDNLAKLYVFKPWDNKELTNTIDQLFEVEELLNNKQLLNLINNITDLPTVPNLYHEICDLIEADASIDHISKKIEKDQSIATKILRVANSAFYGAKTVVLSNSVFNDFGKHKDLHLSLWEHVNITNKLMNAIYPRLLGKKVPNVFASAGLLHDVGRVIVLNYFLEEHDKMIQLAKEDPMKCITELENELIGTNHQLIGGYLLKWWEIPHPIVEVAMFHHDPLNLAVINKELVAVVHLANYYSWEILHDDIFKERLEEGVFERLGITHEDLKVIVDEIANESRQF